MSYQKFCEQCGASLREETRFCESCGAPTGSRVKETSVVVPPASSEPPSEPGSRVEAVERGGGGSLKPVLITLACIALVVIVGMAGWWFGFNPFQKAAPLPPGLVAMGDFTEGSPPGMEGDGRRLADGGNPSWQMQGPDDMAIDLPLNPTSGGGSIAVSCRVLIPEATTTDSQLGGVRIRFRFTDRNEGSGIVDHVLQASDDWQTISHTFEDTGSGPYRLGIEAFGFSGLLYFDDLDARLTEDGTASRSPGSAEVEVAASNANSASPLAAPETSELEKWVVKQPWFQRLAASMPDGVTLSIRETDGGFEGWTPFEIREHHSAESGFDPNVAPTVGLFEVSPKRDGLAWYDPVSDDWQPIEDFIAIRGL